MTGKVQTPEWASAPYWGGFDINVDSNFNPTADRQGTISNRVHNAAAHVLATSLEGVIRGDFEEEEGAPWGGFDPIQSGLEDGTVVMLERESLSRVDYNDTWRRESEDHSDGNLPTDAAEFVEYWRDHYQDKHGPIGRERKSSGRGGERSYERTLEWGVLVPYMGKKFVISWLPNELFYGSDVDDGFVSIRDSLLGKIPHRTPIKLGKAEPKRLGHTDICRFRTVERTTAVRVVRADGAADYTEAYRNASPVVTALGWLAPRGASLQRPAEIVLASSFPPR